MLRLVAIFAGVINSLSVESGTKHTSELLYSMVQPGRLLAFYPFDGTADSAVPFQRWVGYGATCDYLFASPAFPCGKSHSYVAPSLCSVNGTGSAGSVVGDGIVSTNVAVEGLAYSFPGDGTQFIEVPLNVDPGEHPQITMGAWVKPASWGKYRSSDTASFDPMRFILSSDSNEGQFSRALGIRSQSVDQVGWSAFMGERSAQQDATLPVGELGTWSFVAVVYNQYDGTMLLYVNGETILNTHSQLRFGRPALRIGGSGMSMPYYFALYL